ncbi:hypothetical protein IMG5_098620 [Ichthyophthirius multifiliis]|uniref:TLDc domain-containing protein n=1 Tax=Ichthyophthirius multifiliis TaxID=5932 RepID=G0QRZ6_ICHMU|nr:hypothetical protein IMG5_098620 [Ichthyophthirius multifiliis]EGR32026.1 hypothetical protein IMG5_098620 [Ichthyophthirius multifiliis]|eukprot:XP_004035512.1 hypothetical protein IMG5_098620 [Ichthyophthirius multifiliis]
MGCTESRKTNNQSFTVDEIQRLKRFHTTYANQYNFIQNVDNLSLEAFQQIFKENKLLGQCFYKFIIDSSKNGKANGETFIDALELICKKPTNQMMIEKYSSFDRIELLTIILNKRLRKKLDKIRFATITYSEAYDFIQVTLQMFNENYENQINQDIIRNITDNTLSFNQGNIDWWSFCIMIREQLVLLTQIIQQYFYSKFLEKQVSFHLPKLPQGNQLLQNNEHLSLLFLNNIYLSNFPKLKLVYSSNEYSYKFEDFVKELTAFKGPTFVLVQFIDDDQQKYVIGGFNQNQWINNSVQGDRESYVFSLYPRYRNFFPLEEQTKGFLVNNTQIEYCSINNQGLSFGGSRRDNSRIWIDAKNLKDSSCKNNSDFNYRRGYLINLKAKNLIANHVEVYGLYVDQEKLRYSKQSDQKNNFYNHNEIKEILNRASHIKTEVLKGIDVEKQSTLRSVFNQNNPVINQRISVIQQSPNVNITQKDEITFIEYDKVVKATKYKTLTEESEVIDSKSYNEQIIQRRSFGKLNAKVLMIKLVLMIQDKHQKLIDKILIKDLIKHY